MRFLSEADVARLIDPAMAIATAEEAYALQAGGAVPRPGRINLAQGQPRSGALVLAGLGPDGLMAVKVNGHGWPAEGGPRVARSLLTLWDLRKPAALATIAATGFTDHRTAAGFAAAAKVLAPVAAATLTVFGAGKLAAPILRYIPLVRPIERIFVVGRAPERARRLAQRARLWPELAGIAVEAVEDAEAATRQADIIATATSSDQPVFAGRLVRPGALVILGGANRPGAREADDDLMRRGDIYTDDEAGALEKAGDLVIPLSSGVLRREALCGDIGKVLGRTLAPARPDSVSVFKSIGIASQDLMLARWLLARAEAAGVGQELDLDSSEPVEDAA